MRIHAVDPIPRLLSRRSFLQALGLAFACRCQPFVSRFTAIADDVDWLMRWCCYGAGPRFATAR